MTNSPIERIKVGDVELSIWQNKAPVDGRTVFIPNITFDRPYCVNGQFKATKNFRRIDLPHLKEAIEKAEKFLSSFLDE